MKEQWRFLALKLAALMDYTAGNDNPGSDGRDSPSQDEHPYPPLLPSAKWNAVARRHALTPRELEVVRLVCRGLTNSAISTRLRMSPDTLRTHTRSVYRKLKRRNRVDLVLWIVHSEILPKPPETGSSHT